MFRSISKYIYFSFIPFVLLGLLTVVLFAVQVIPTYYLWFTLIGWALIAGLGVEVGFHRMFSHGHYRAIPKWKENLILFLGCLGGQGSSLSWAALHRQHHKHTDKALDLHSPQVHSKWHAFFGWGLLVTEANNPINFKYVAGLLKKPNHAWFHEHHLLVLWLTPAVVALYDWKLALAALCLPTGVAILVNNLVNVVCHSKFWGNYRNYDTGDCSHNNFLLGLLSWGLGYHNNHHGNPALFLHGSKKWEVDPCVMFKFFLR